MSIVRIEKKEKNFSIIDNSVINDKRLSWKARGILVFLLSKPNHWETKLTNLINSSEKDGDVAVRSALKELRELGYAKLIRGEFNGKLGSFYTIYEYPNK